MSFKLIIAGGRDYWPTQEESDALDDFSDLVDEVVSGHAEGVDAWGEAWAKRHGIPVKLFPAKWMTEGKIAGFKRNEQMASYADALAVFTGGRGTADMVERALIHGLEIHDFRKPPSGACRVVNRKVTEEYDLYIGRGTKWGNPFIEGVDGSRKTVIQRYHAWLLRQPELLEDLHELRGKVLGCSCKPKPCHGDVLAELVNLRWPVEPVEPVKPPEEELDDDLR